MLRTIGKHIVSIRFTAVIMILAASVVPLLAVRGIVVNSFLERQIKQLETKLLNTGNILSADIGKSGYFDRQYDDRINAQVEQLSYMYSGRIVVVASNYNVVKDTYVDQENKTLVSYEVNQAFHGIVTSSYDSRYGIIEITQPIYSSNGNNIIGVLMFAVPDTSIRENVRYRTLYYIGYRRNIYRHGACGTCVCVWNKQTFHKTCRGNTWNDKRIYG